MALGKYAVDYEMRVDYDRLRKERLKRAKDQINKDGLGAIDELVECWLPYK